MFLRIKKDYEILKYTFGIRRYNFDKNIYNIFKVK